MNDTTTDTAAEAWSAWVALNPWPTVALVALIVIVLVVVAPAVWSRRPARRRAALDVLRTLGEACRAVASPFSSAATA